MDSVPEHLLAAPDGVFGNVDRWIEDEYESGQAFWGYIALFLAARGMLDDIDDMVERQQMIADLTHGDRMA